MSAAAQRIRLSRARGWRKPVGAVVVARPSRWGNPFTLEAYGSRAAAVAAYASWIEAPEQALLRQAVRRELADKDLCCWCPLDGPCHADVLLRIAGTAQPAGHT